MPAGRPPIPIDQDKLLKFASIGCTMIELASLFDCSVDTLERNYADLIDKGRQHLHMSLRRQQYQSAEKGNVAMQIWLGKQLLGQSDKQEITGKDGGPLATHSVLTDEQIDARIAALLPDKTRAIDVTGRESAAGQIQKD